uniref:Uncharacterized protein n=1 Tax=Rhizophora mucronata TaxID=61149 RepID=A0A2P2PVS8_RHIMU
MKQRTGEINSSSSMVCFFIQSSDAFPVGLCHFLYSWF